MQVTPAGSVAAFTAAVDAEHGSFFCKGVIAEGGPALRGARTEAALNPCLPAAIVPRLRWTVETDKWLVLGFEQVRGHHADLSPNSSALPRIAAILTALAKDLTPCPPVPVQAAPARWGNWIGRRLGDARARRRLDRPRTHDHQTHQSRTHPRPSRKMGHLNSGVCPSPGFLDHGFRAGECSTRRAPSRSHRIRTQQPPRHSVRDLVALSIKVLLKAATAIQR